jgi:hypothetical protein
MIYLTLYGDNAAAIEAYRNSYTIKLTSTGPLAPVTLEARKMSNLQVVD